MLTAFLNRTRCRLGSSSLIAIPSSTRSFASAVPENIDEDIYAEETIPETGEWAGCKRSFLAPISTTVRGADTLYNPLFNKGTAFKSGERDRLRIRGLLPHRMTNIALQKERFLSILRAEKSMIKKNLVLEDLHDRNETLYHRVLVEHMEEMAPLIYTPTVGQACMEFAARFRRPRGMYFTPEDRGNMAAMVYNWPHKDVHVIVVTDGSRILGLGDLGANGMGIPIGKLSLYCAAGGIAPHRVMPVVLDVGTDNETLLNDNYYLGVPTPRLKGADYYQLVDEFMHAVRFRWPNVLVQFEDFSSSVAQKLLDKYREDHLCFNDDIQGTGATTLAGLLCSLRAKGDDVTALGDQKILIVGAGSAGIGIAQVLMEAMIEQGRSEEEARDAFFVVDQHGLLGKQRFSELNAEQREYARDEDDGLPVLDVIRKYKPSVIVGVTAMGGLFTEPIIREMAANNERPIIFPLSNPTVKAECTAEQAYKWTDGRCIFASGSPFDPVTMGERTYYPSQCNNMYIFPGLGLGATLCGATKITNRMIYLAAETLAKFVPAEEVAKGVLFPPLSQIRDVSHAIGVAVAREAIRDGLATRSSAKAAKDLDAFVSKKMYYPEYVPLVEKHEVTI